MAPRWFPVTFLLDTGASSTCIHPERPVVGAGITIPALVDPTGWPKPLNRGGVGGPAIYYEMDAVYAFLDTSGNIQTVNAPIEIAQYRPENVNLPPLLGRDVLQKCVITMDWATGKVELNFQ